MVLVGLIAKHLQHTRLIFECVGGGGVAIQSCLLYKGVSSLPDQR